MAVLSPALSAVTDRVIERSRGAPGAGHGPEAGAGRPGGPLISGGRPRPVALTWT